MIYSPEYIIYLPQFNEIIVYHPLGMSIETRDGFEFPLRLYNSGKLIQESLGEL